MKWTFNIKNKIKASLILLFLCGIVFFSNYRLKRLSVKVAESVQTMYEDRLIVQDIIYSYSKILSRIENMEEDQFNQSVRNTVAIELLELNNKYGKTVFTEEEAEVFDAYSLIFNSMIKGKVPHSPSTFKILKDKLNRLEEIQMEEARKQMKIIHDSNGSQELSFYIETVILVILLIVVQVLVVSYGSSHKNSKNNKVKFNQN